MKHVFVATRGGSGEIVAVSTRRKRIRKALDADRARSGAGPLVWKKKDWSPWRYMGDRLVPAPYIVEKFGVL